MQKRLLSLLCAAFFLLPLLVAAPIHGADSTSFDPTKVEVKAQGSGGVPVGMILAWPVGQNPEDMDNWLECNGQSISQSVYPELFALLGGQVPDLRGKTLFGQGRMPPSGQLFVNIGGNSAPNHIDGIQDVQVGSIGLRTYVWGSGTGGQRARGYSQVEMTNFEATRYLIRARP